MSRKKPKYRHPTDWMADLAAAITIVVMVVIIGIAMLLGMLISHIF